MLAAYKNFAFYTVEIEYLKQLHNIDSEVYYTSQQEYSHKPFLGILAMINGYSYFIPFTSRKAKHSGWKLRSSEHFLIYEVMDGTKLHTDDVFKPHNGTQVKKLLSVLDIKKMIPVPEILCSRIDFAALSDRQYRTLLLKEYNFCSSIRTDILKAADMIYTKQKSSGKVYPFYCDFSKLEMVYDEYISKHS